jgi:hypothetical protein
MTQTPFSWELHPGQFLTGQALASTSLSSSEKQEMS